MFWYIIVLELVWLAGTDFLNTTLGKETQQKHLLKPKKLFGICKLYRTFKQGTVYVLSVCVSNITACFCPIDGKVSFINPPLWVIKKVIDKSFGTVKNQLYKVKIY